MHRTVTNTILSILLIALIIIVLPANAFAASASASVSSSTVKPGDTVTVTVTFRGSDIGVVDGTFSYDPSILQYTGGAGTSGGGGSGLIKLVTSTPNSSSLTATMNFKALKAGSATVSAKADLILSYHEEKSLGTASASTRVTVKAPSRVAVHQVNLITVVQAIPIPQIIDTQSRKPQNQTLKKKKKKLPQTLWKEPSRSPWEMNNFTYGKTCLL